MQISVTWHPSRISRELIASRSLGTRSDVLATACTGGVSGGSVSDGSADATFTNDSGSSEAAVVSVLVTNSAATATSALLMGAFSALAMEALLVSVAGGGAYATPKSAKRNGALWSTMEAVVSLMPAELKANQATTQPAKSSAATSSNRRAFMIPASNGSKLSQVAQPSMRRR